MARSVVLLTGSMGTAARRQGAPADVIGGEAGIVIGTHALLEDTVEFADLGLVVVDEQHRFGVEQRDALRDKAGTPPHVLVMTATPIPRTVAMTVFGDLETSVLSELPAGRSPIATNVVPLAEQPAWISPGVGAGRARRSPPATRRTSCAPASATTPRRRPSRTSATSTRTATVVTARRSARRRRGPAAAAPPARSPASGRGAARPDAARRQGRTHAPLRGGRDRRPGRDHRHRGRRRRAQRHRHGASWTPTGSASPSSTSCAAGSVEAGSPACACWSPGAEAGSPARDRLDAVASTPDGFELSRIDLEQRREGDVLGAAQSGVRSSLVSLRVLRDDAGHRPGPRRPPSRCWPPTRTSPSTPDLGRGGAGRIERSSAPGSWRRR